MRRLSIALLVLTGCAHFYKLDVKSVTALEVGDAKRSLCARGGLVDVFAVTNDGKRHAEGQKQHINENEFDPDLVRLTASVGSFHDRSWNPPEDPLAMLKEQSVTVTATLIANPAITATAQLAPTWAGEPPVAYVGGQDGSEGKHGAGGDKGADGGPGARGGNGDKGFATVVTIGWIDPPGHPGQRLALADVKAEGGNESLFVVDPSTTLTVLAIGGGGGAGGQGGSGGNDPEGHGGRGGRGGDGGDGGEGGVVTLRYDAKHPELVKLVNVDVSGGAPGPAGAGGYGGLSAPTSQDGFSGDLGHEGQHGRDGRVTKLAVPDLDEQVAALLTGGALQQATPPPAAPPGVPLAHDTADGARYYEGRAEITLTSDGRPPMTQTANLRVESTRTRKQHFTIKFAGCTLQFHRPTGETQLRYDLDEPTRCTDDKVVLDVRSAKLILDSAHRALQLFFEASAPAGAKASFTFVGARR